jgi:hypothetical protein
MAMQGLPLECLQIELSALDTCRLQREPQVAQRSHVPGKIAMVAGVGAALQLCSSKS